MTWLRASHGCGVWPQVRSQDISSFVTAIAGAGSVRANMAWMYITANLPTFEAAFGGTPADKRRSVDRMLARVAARLSHQRDVVRVQKFFDSRAEEQGGSVARGADRPPYVQDALASIRRRAWARAHVAPAACLWLAEHGVPANG
jgi:hypothetical protein